MNNVGKKQNDYYCIKKHYNKSLDWPIVKRDRIQYYTIKQQTVVWAEIIIQNDDMVI